MKAFVCFLLMLSLFGCGTRKTEFIEQRDIHSFTAEKLQEKEVTGVTVQDSRSERFSRLKGYRITSLSQPDSTGTQYPTQIEEGTVLEEWEGDRLIQSDTIHIRQTEKDTEQTFDDQTLTTQKESKDNRPIPVWVWCVLIAITILILTKWLKT